VYKKLLLPFFATKILNNYTSVKTVYNQLANCTRTENLFTTNATRLNVLQIAMQLVKIANMQFDAMQRYGCNQIQCKKQQTTHPLNSLPSLL
jgi:hypothetical protein